MKLLIMMGYRGGRGGMFIKILSAWSETLEGRDFEYIDCNNNVSGINNGETIL